MNVSEYSVLMAVLWSDAVILLIYFLRRSLWFVRTFGLNTMFLLCGGCILRLCAGFEFEATVEVRIPQMNFAGKLLEKSVPLGSYEIPVTALLVTVWSFVGAVLVFRVVRKHHHEWEKYRLLPTAGPKVERFLSEVVDGKDTGRISVSASPLVASPCISGIFRGTICLPVRNWKRKELLCVLRHEYAHFRHHDALTGLLADLFCALFWWNPCVYLLKRSLKEILEFRADEEVTRNMKPSDGRYYCLMLVKFAGAVNSAVPCFAASKLECRVVRILDRPFSVQGKRVSGLIVLLAAALLFVLSYSVVLQPYFTPELETIWCEVSKADFTAAHFLEADGSYVFSTETGNIPVSGNEINKMQEKRMG